MAMPPRSEGLLNLRARLFLKVPGFGAPAPRLPRDSWTLAPARASHRGPAELPRRPLGDQPASAAIAAGLANEC